MFGNIIYVICCRSLNINTLDIGYYWIIKLLGAFEMGLFKRVIKFKRVNNLNNRNNRIQSLINRMISRIITDLITPNNFLRVVDQSV